MNDLMKRKGEFSITKTCLVKNPDSVQEIFKRVIPVGVKYDYLLEIFTYQAVSMDFDVVEEGYRMPEYKVSIRKENGKISKAVFTK